MTISIEGLHRTSRLWGGYVEGVKVIVTTVSKVSSILPPPPLSDHKCHLMIRLRANVPSQMSDHKCHLMISDQVKGRPSSDKEISPTNDDCRASLSHVSLEGHHGGDDGDSYVSSIAEVW